MTSRYIGLKQLRQNMAGIAKRAFQRNEHLIVLRKNVPIFKLVPVYDEDGPYGPDFVRSIAESERDIAAGRTYTTDEVRKSLASRRRARRS